MSVLYFAEYLARIRSIAVSLQFPHGATGTKLRFRDVRTAVVHYFQGDDEHTREIRLPEDVTVTVSESIVELQNNNTVSFRLPASPEQHSKHQPATSFHEASGPVPWSATEIRRAEGQVKVKCRDCKSVVSNTISTWKDMPSEHWAETMDFWHCHKPHEDQQSHNVAYSVSQFIPSPSSAFVGAAYFLLKREDVMAKLENGAVLCPDCGAVLGEDHMDYLQLWKWALELEGADLVPLYPAEVFVSCILLDLVDAHAIFTFLIEGDNDEKMLLWVFNLDVKLVTGDMDRAERAFKVFYSSSNSDIPALQQTRGDIEIVRLPGTIFTRLQRQLEHHTLSFPENARNFGKWNVSILRRHQL